MELILEKIWKRVVKKKLWKKPGKKLILPWWVKNEEKKLKKANVQNLQIGLLLKIRKIKKCDFLNKTVYLRILCISNTNAG